MNGFQPYDYGAAVGAGTRNALMEMQGLEAGRRMQEQNAIRQMMQQEDPQAALRAGGFPQQAQQMALQDAEFQLKGLEYVKKFAPTIANEGQYKNFKQQAERLGFSSPGVLPETYDEGTKNLLKTMAGNAQVQYETITGPGGSILQRDPAGKLTQVIGREPKGTTVNVGGEQPAFVKEYGKIQAARLGKIVESAEEADAMLSDAQNFRSILSSVETGAMAPAELFASRWGQSLGLTEGDTAKIAAGEAVEALGNKLALYAKKDLPGPLSDADRKFLINTAPGLAKTKEGNMILIRAIESMAERRKLKSEMAQDWAEQKGSMKGFDKHWNSYMKENPMFKAMEQPTPETLITPTQQQYDAMPSGTVYISPINGKRYRKP